jgi:hypothetical protein
MLELKVKDVQSWKTWSVYFYTKRYFKIFAPLQYRKNAYGNTIQKTNTDVRSDA